MVVNELVSKGVNSTASCFKSECVCVCLCVWSKCFTQRLFVLSGWADVWHEHRVHDDEKCFATCMITIHLTGVKDCYCVIRRLTCSMRRCCVWSPKGKVCWCAAICLQDVGDCCQLFAITSFQVSACKVNVLSHPWTYGLTFIIQNNYNNNWILSCRFSGENITV